MVTVLFIDFLALIFEQISKLPQEPIYIHF